MMGDNRTISQSTFGNNARIHQGEVIAYVEGSVSVTNNYGISPESTEKRDGEDDILRRLYTSPYDDRKDRNPPRVSGTCEWFTSHELFKEWERSESSRLLWVSADPGCGKSVLVKHLVDSVLQTTESRTVCYFFFKDDFSDQRNVVDALRCILRQIFIRKPLLLSDKVLRQFTAGGETFFNSFTELWKTLIQVSKDQSAGEIICILDAIDECEDQGSQLTQELCKLYGAANDFHLKFLLTSRPYGKIYRGFRPLEISELRIIHLSGESEDEIRKISQEIDIFIRSRVEDVGVQLRLIKEEQDLLLQGLMQIPNRTYLWAHLTLDLIMKDLSIDRARIANAVSGIPEEIDEAYEKILSKSHDVEQAKKILHIVVAAARPLTLEEMNLALALQNSHRSNNDIELKPEERFRQELRDICGLFITILDSKIYLLHQTAKEFLLEDNTDPHTEGSGRSTWKHSINMLESHSILSDICIWYLCNLEFDINRNNGTKTLDLLAEDMIFLDYSAKYWATHFRELHIKAQNEKTELILKICDGESKHCRMWFKTYWISTNTEYPHGFTSLMITAYFGLQTAVQYFLNNKVEINYTDDMYWRSALSWAIRNGFDTIAKLLVKGGRLKVPWRKGAKVNQVDRYGRTPLSYAVWNGSTAMVELLVKTGALTHLKDELGGTPLSYAYLSRNEQIIDLLLQKKNKADFENDIINLLFSALEKGHEEVVELVLKTTSTRINLNAENEKGQTPLFCAAYYGHTAVIKVLLERGADPNCRDRMNQTPLLYAAEQNDVAMAKALLERGADPNCKNNDHETPLLCATKGGHLEAVEILLKEGADPNCKKNNHETPLLFAARMGNIEAVKALLEGGADSKHGDKSGRTPLSYAAGYGHEEVVEALLEGGANLNSEANSGRAPLSYAAEYGHVAVIEILIDRGANPNQEDIYNRTPLMHAAKKGRLMAVTELLGKGANPNYEDMYRRVPHFYADENGHKRVEKLLLEAGANSKPPVPHTTEKSHETAVKLLLKEGADIKRLLLWAAEKNYEAVTKVLLEGLEETNLATLLLWAKEQGHEAIARALSERCAKMKHEDEATTTTTTTVAVD